MKLLSMLLMLVITGASCTKSKELVLVKGKVIHRSCASVVVQVLDPKYYNLGQQTWQQQPSKPIYQHVFDVENQCTFPAGIGEGSVITFKIIAPGDSKNDCFICMLWDNPPHKKQFIDVVDL